MTRIPLPKNNAITRKLRLAGDDNAVPCNPKGGLTRTGDGATQEVRQTRRKVPHWKAPESPPR